MATREQNFIKIVVAIFEKIVIFICFLKTVNIDLLKKWGEKISDMPTSLSCRALRRERDINSKTTLFAPVDLKIDTKNKKTQHR